MDIAAPECKCYGTKIQILRRDGGTHRSGQDRADSIYTKADQEGLDEMNRKEVDMIGGWYWKNKKVKQKAGWGGSLIRAKSHTPNGKVCLAQGAYCTASPKKCNLIKTICKMGGLIIFRKQTQLKNKSLSELAN